MNSSEGGQGHEGRRLYNPYGDLYGGSIDYTPMRNIYELPTSPEFLFQEEAAVQRRSWGENITYYTGCGYLSGAVTGAGVGLVDGLKAREPGDSLKLRINRVLNASGHTGRKFGNRLGIIGLLYAGMESGIVAARGTDDVYNSILAGLGTGALFRATAGLRSAAVAGAIGGLAVGAVVAGKQALKRYVPL
uniref:Mitochondrial import inner membrane translocase subunit TIM23 n=1 Tax=Araucaria cunninghamii TaxID=56994 RepID=A0A0D6R648_ARACU